MHTTQLDETAVLALLQERLRLLRPAQSAKPKTSRRRRVDNDVTRHPLLPARNAWLEGSGCLIVAAHSPATGTQQIDCLRIAAFAEDRPGDHYHAALDAAKAAALSVARAGRSVRIYQVRRAHSARELRLVMEVGRRLPA